MGDNTLGIPLLTNDSASGPAVVVRTGGRYLWSAAGTFSGATLTLQGLAPDGTTYIDTTTLTAAGKVNVSVGEGETVRVTVTGGSPSGLYSSLARSR